jgi:segregation and condensation protein A
VDSPVEAFLTEKYTVATPVYQGPLDLLLELIEHAELDITSLALAQVTDQFLAYLRNLVDCDPGEVSAFLVIAARLIQIKSEALLPRPVQRPPGEEDPGQSLAQQLVIYRRFKQIGEYLGSREEAGLRTYLHIGTAPDLETRLDMTGVTLSDLVFAAQAVYAGSRDLNTIHEVVSIPLLTIRDRMRWILHRVKSGQALSFKNFTEPHQTRIELIVTFLAVLELVKQRILFARQDQLFEDVHFEAEPGWTGDEDIDLELDD